MGLISPGGQNLLDFLDTILIAHRITTVQGMDKIIFVDDGKISAVGTHEQLLQTCPDYKTMVELQKLEEEKGDAINE